MGVYPGLGMGLRYYYSGSREKDAVYPIGSHSYFSGSESDLLPVREFAMMAIMNQLTEKPDWHKKVWDDKIVAKWRDEALSIPDKVFWYEAGTWPEPFPEDGDPRLRGFDFTPRMPEGIMNGDLFEWVRFSCLH
jgi:hypothetical protein